MCLKADFFCCGRFSGANLVFCRHPEVVLTLFFQVFDGVKSDGSVHGCQTLPFVRGCQTLLNDVSCQLNTASVERWAPLKSHTSAGNVSNLCNNKTIWLHYINKLAILNRYKVKVKVKVEPGRPPPPSECHVLFEWPLSKQTPFRLEMASTFKISIFRF